MLLDQKHPLNQRLLIIFCRLFFLSSLLSSSGDSPNSSITWLSSYLLTQTTQYSHLIDLRVLHFPVFQNLYLLKSFPLLLYQLLCQLVNSHMLGRSLILHRIRSRTSDIFCHSSASHSANIPLLQFTTTCAFFQ